MENIDNQQLELEQPLFKDIQIDKKILDIRGKFFHNIFNSDFIQKSGDYIMTNDKFNEKSLKLLQDDPFFDILLELKKKESEGIEENSHTIDIDLHSQETSVEIPLHPAKPIVEERKIEYSRLMDKVLISKFSKFGVYKNFELLIKNANKLYEEEEEISKYHKLIINDQSSEIQKIIMSRKENNFIRRLNLELKLISYVDEEIDKRKNLYKTLLDETGRKLALLYQKGEIEDIKILFEKDFELNSIFRLIQILYETSSFHKWVPFIEAPKTTKHIKKAKKCFYIKFNMPVIQDRDLLLYQFVNNKLKEKEVPSIQFLSKSYDNESALLDYNTIVHNEEAIRMDLKISSFDIKIIDKELIRIHGFIHIDPRTRCLPQGYVEVLSLQYMKALFANLDNLINLDDYQFKQQIPKNEVDVKSVQFYEFIESQLAEIGYQTGFMDNSD